MRNFQMQASCVVQHAISVLLLAFAAGCGSGAGAASTPPPPPVLASSALLTMDVTASRLTSSDLIKDAPIDGFSDKLSALGFETGARREFRGPTNTFSTVVSRSLLFDDAAGARGYVQLVSDRVGDFFGKGSKVRPAAIPGPLRLPNHGRLLRLPPGDADPDRGGARATG